MLQETTPTPNKKPKRNKTARKKSVKKCNRHRAVMKPKFLEKHVKSLRSVSLTGNGKRRVT